MDKFEIKTAFNRVKYDKKFDPGNMANVNDILYANPMQGVMEQIQDVIHESDLAHDNFIKECIVSVGIDPNALKETAKLNAKLQYELKTLRVGMLRLADPWISVEERLPESGVHCLIGCTVKRFDGTHGQYVCVGYYAEKFKNLAYGVDDDCVSEYNEEDDEYYISEGWYEVIKNWDDYGFVAISDTVTHWMPLPEPPKGENK